MKKILLLLIGVLFLGNTAMAANTVTVSQVTGQPQIVRGNETLTVQPGTACQTGDILKTTTPGCSLDMTVNGLAGCRVLPSSECVIANADVSDMRVRITSGNAILNLKKLPVGSSFQVETPTAVATVRGTQFWGRVDTQNIKNPVTTFAVREGSVVILAKNIGQTFTLAPGQALDIPLDNSQAPAIRPALDEEMKAMEQASSIRNSA